MKTSDLDSSPPPRRSALREMIDLYVALEDLERVSSAPGHRGLVENLGVTAEDLVGALVKSWRGSELDHVIEQLDAGNQRDVAEVTRLLGETGLAPIRLVGHVLEAARQSLPDDPDRSRFRANVAVSLALDFAGEFEAHGFAYLAHAQCFLANVCRIEGRFDAAWQHLRLARETLAGWISPPLVEGELRMVESLLRQDQARLQAALALSSRGIRAFEKTGRRDLVWMARMARASILLRMDRPEAAAGTIRRLVSEIRPERDPRLALTIRANYCLYLCGCGRFEAALGHYRASRDLWEHFDDQFTQLRRSWLEGKIHLGLKNFPLAERRLRTAYQGFLAADAPQNAALAAMDLGICLHAAGADLQGHAAELMPLLRAFPEVHVEARQTLERHIETLRSNRVDFSIVLRFDRVFHPRDGAGDVSGAIDRDRS